MPFPHPSKLIFLVPQDFKSSLVTWGLMLTCPGTTGYPCWWLGRFHIQK